MSKYFNEKAETMSREELAAHQLAKLKDTVRCPARRAKPSE